MLSKPFALVSSRTLIAVVDLTSIKSWIDDVYVCGDHQEGIAHNSSHCRLMVSVATAPLRPKEYTYNLTNPYAKHISCESLFLEPFVATIPPLKTAYQQVLNEGPYGCPCANL